MRTGVFRGCCAGEAVVGWARAAWLFLALGGTLSAGQFRAGVARVEITPPMPYWLTGYAGREKPASAVRSALWAKALALDDGQGGRAVIVTTDLIGLPALITDAVASELRGRHGLKRSEILFNSSHTHAGPAILPTLQVMLDVSAEEMPRLLVYRETLAAALGAVVDSAIAKIQPARLDCGHGSAAFAANRREFTPSGVKIGVNPEGPVDHDVPVLRVSAPDGTLRAALFGYACHNTTLGSKFFDIDGDYAGAAQREFEKAHPGATAMFLMLCGGDQNPNPRGSADLAEAHGGTLARAADEALAGRLAPVRAPIRTAWTQARLEFAPHTRAAFEKEASETDRFKQRRARAMLDAYDKGRPVRDVACPVQAIRLGNDFTLLGLGGEVVVDYALRAKREFPGENLVVAGYCNDVMCYIPTARILREGGYEPVTSMIYYGQPGPFAETVEESLFAAIRTVMGGAEAAAAGAPGR